jgi:L-rhamnose mutarotase
MWVVDVGKCRANKYLQKYSTFQSEERQLIFANWHYNRIEHMNLK